MIVGKGDNPLSAVYAGVVAEAAILAAGDRDSCGEAYNITSHGPITQREFLDLFADAFGYPRVRRHVPYSLAYAGGFLLEMQDRLLDVPGLRESPAMEPGSSVATSNTAPRKRRTRLGWRPSIRYAESIERTVRWFQDQARAIKVSPAAR